MDAIMRLTLATLLLTAQSVSASPTPATIQACTEIEKALPRKVFTQNLLAIDYKRERLHYWSTALQEVYPACIVQPVDAQDVSVVVKILNKYPSVLFATTSGGHDPNFLHSTVPNGVVITMSNMIGATYDAAKRVATVKPGGHWDDVMPALEAHGVTIAGGRLGIVGVGGLLLGGGLSFLSAQEGLAADNIIGWETVMANGSIVNIDAKARPDLAQAMRGSGSQFGIVTSFIVNVHTIGEVWGGYCNYDNFQEDKLYAALHHYAESGSSENPKTAIIFSDIIFAANVTSKFIYYFNDGPAPPTSGAFAEFFKDPSPGCVLKRQKYSELIKSNGQYVAVLKARAIFASQTIPVIPSRPQMYAEIRDKLASIVGGFLLNPGRGFQFTANFLMLPSIIGKHSVAKGGNAMGLTDKDPERIIVEMQGSYFDKRDDAEVQGLGKQFTDWLAAQVPLWLDEAGMSHDVYLPYFLNSARSYQPVMQSYSGYENFKVLQEEVDPQGLWKRAGGFKY